MAFTLLFHFLYLYLPPLAIALPQATAFAALLFTAGAVGFGAGAGVVGLAAGAETLNVFALHHFWSAIVDSFPKAPSILPL